MPELPEVETTAHELKPLVKGKVFDGLWVAHLPMLRRPKNKKSFFAMIRGEKVLDVKRRGKMVWFRLTRGKNLFVHQKLSGHLLYGRWRRAKNGWEPADRKTEALWRDPTNRFLRLLFLFRDTSGPPRSRGAHSGPSRIRAGRSALALSDVRKFGRAYALEDDEIEKTPELKAGVDPLENDFDLGALRPALARRAITAKQALLDQTLVAGIGNIYADEILWQAKIAPFRRAKDLTTPQYRTLTAAIVAVLKKALKARGASIDNYRRPRGALGSYQELRAVYQREGEPCPRCRTRIKRVTIGGRSSHYCPRCQA